MIEKAKKVRLSWKPLVIIQKKLQRNSLIIKENASKNLSTSQRDQAYLNMTRGDFDLKRSLVRQLTEATRETNNTA